MTWELTCALARHKLKIVQGMNLLDDAGIISNLCVDPGDIADADCRHAVDYLDHQFGTQTHPTHDEH